MRMPNRYFKCNIVGGFRLSDVNKNIKQGEYFFLDDHVAEVSRSVSASLRSGWMVEVSEKDASKFLIKKELPVAVKNQQTTKFGTAFPEATSKKLESRQAEYLVNKDLEVAVPDLKVVEKNEKTRAQDTLSKAEVTTPKKIKASRAKETEKVAIPDFKAVEEKNKIAVEVSVTKDEGMFDNSLVSTPNLAAQNIKQDLEQQIEKKVRRRRTKKEV